MVSVDGDVVAEKSAIGTFPDEDEIVSAVRAKMKAT